MNKIVRFGPIVLIVTLLFACTYSDPQGVSSSLIINPSNPQGDSSSLIINPSDPLSTISDETSSFVPQEGVSEINIISINDFHGAVQATSSFPGLSALGAQIRSLEADNPEGTIILAAGDMFQGSALSNLTYGKVVIDGMNELGFEAMTIGNHEFDWGVDILESHHNGQLDDGEAEFPYLACNIYEDQGTSSTVDDVKVSWAQDYQIVERRGLKIGIIGWIGEGLESSIAVDRVDGYTFYDPLPIVAQLAEELTQEKNCEIIIAMGHDGESSVNQALANLTGDQKIDYIINGHTHQGYINKVGNIYATQAYSNGGAIMCETIHYDHDLGEVSQVDYPSMIGKAQYTGQSDEAISQIVAQYEEEFDAILNTEIGVAGTTVSKDIALTWVSDVIAKAGGVDLGFGNDTGVRGTFPIANGTSITGSTIYSMMPFDNTIKIGTIRGSDVKKLAAYDSCTFSQGYVESEIVDTAYYQVAANSYVFDKYQIFINSVNQIATNVEVRYALMEDVKAWTAQGRSWRPDQGAVVGKLW